MANLSIWFKKPDRASLGQRYSLNHGPQIYKAPLYKMENVNYRPTKVQEKQNGPKKLIPNPFHSQLPAVSSGI